MKTIIDGLEQFCAFMWKGIVCDKCGVDYTGTLHQWTSKTIRKSATRDGWLCNELSNTDFCPDCKYSQKGEANE